MGSGLKAKQDFARPTDSLIPDHLTHIKSNVGSFQPSSNSLVLESGETVKYDYLIVAAGLGISKSLRGIIRMYVDPRVQITERSRA